MARTGGDGIATGERLARLEQQMEHVVAKVIHATMLQAKGAAWLGRWLMPSITGIIGFVAAQLGGSFHLLR